jgi:regulatory protein
MDDAAARSSVSSAVDAGLRIIAGADQSENAMRRRLERRGFEAETIDDAVARLRDYGYLNDGRLAGSIAGRKIRDGYGRRRVAADLRGRGIAGEAVDDALSNVDAESERDSSLRVARRWMEKHPSMSLAEARRPLGAFLTRRGFGFDVVQSVLRTLGDDPG